MTKKDYVIIAKCLNAEYKNWLEGLRASIGRKDEAGAQQYSHYIFAVQQILSRMFNSFELDNPRFDWQRFKEAVYKK